MLMESSGGLKTSGASDGGCSSSTGQIYSRGEAYGNYFAIMYSCKSSPSFSFLPEFLSSLANS